MTRRKGYTLIELMVVVFILGVIATIAIPVLLTARESALDEKARDCMRTVLTGEVAYYAQHGRYGTLDELANPAEPYLDQRFNSGTGTFESGMTITLQLTNAGQGFEAHAISPSGTNMYASNERMWIWEE